MSQVLVDRVHTHGSDLALDAETAQIAGDDFKSFAIIIQCSDRLDLTGALQGFGNRQRLLFWAGGFAKSSQRSRATESRCSGAR